MLLSKQTVHFEDRAEEQTSDHCCGSGSVFVGLRSSAHRLLICDCTEREPNSRWRHGLTFAARAAATFQPEAKYMSGQVGFSLKNDYMKERRGALSL